MKLFKYKKFIFILAIVVIAVGIMRMRIFLAEMGISGNKLMTFAKSLMGKKTEEELKKGVEELIGGEQEEEIVPVKVARVTRADYIDSITSFGTIRGFGEIPIKFKESGIISKFYFKEGDNIRRGQLVVSQDQQEENIKLEYTRIEYEKNKALYELGAITQDKLRQAELELKTAELEIKKRIFYAPSNGIMGTRKVEEGELVEPNDIVATFLDINNVFCEVGVIEKDIGKVKVGQKSSVVFDAISDTVFDGVVDSVSPMIEGRSRTQTVRILVPNRNSLIKPGMFARAQITTFEQKNGIVVPLSALKKTETGHVAFGVERVLENKETTPAGFEIAISRIINVDVAKANDESALIASGLSEGQEIVLESPTAKEEIKDGGKIEIISEEDE
ncbi:MAG: efflux RND transporter periplasmic adaptor subunit [Candidatus Omnitrophica bacterium]|nr:efflux RND transporter periplasmic adaptor subunit [Candidatus Omnitrophota bacterium]